MKSGIAGGVIAVLVLVLIIVGYGSLFTVYQTRQAIVVRLGQPVNVITEPGLHFKVPLIDNVILIDKRILDLENPAQEVIASDQKRLVVDAFARYKIQNPLMFYQTVGSIEGANSRLSTMLNSALRRVLGESTFTHLVRDERSALMGRIREQLDREAKAFGIEVVDVRIRRADLPEQNSQAVYDRMKTERLREATEIRGTHVRAILRRATEVRAQSQQHHVLGFDRALLRIHVGWLHRLGRLGVTQLVFHLGQRCQRFLGAAYHVDRLATPFHDDHLTRLELADVGLHGRSRGFRLGARVPR
jgi:membrane protease subunit HflC